MLTMKSVADASPGFPRDSGVVACRTRQRVPIEIEGTCAPLALGIPLRRGA
jgi:hypothetical protein